MTISRRNAPGHAHQMVLDPLDPNLAVAARAVFPQSEKYCEQFVEDHNAYLMKICEVKRVQC